MPWLMALFFRHMCWQVGYWVPRLHEPIARIAIQQFQGERSSSYRGWFLWHQPKLHACFLVGNPIQNDAKARSFLHQSWIPPQKWGGNLMTPVLIGCLWFSYCSCLSHKAAHIEEENNDDDICHQILRMENTKDDGTKHHKIEKRNQLRI